MERTPGGHNPLYDEWVRQLDAHLERGADAELLVSVLGVKLAEVMARVIVGTPAPRDEAEAWVQRVGAMLDKTIWSLVQELKAQRQRPNGRHPT